MDPQIKLSCLQLAIDLSKPIGNYDVDSIVKLASMLYDFIQAPPPDENQVEIADKPKRGRPAKPVDILS